MARMNWSRVHREDLAVRRKNAAIPRHRRGRIITVRYPKACLDCGKHIARGATARWIPHDGIRHANSCTS